MYPDCSAFLSTCSSDELRDMRMLAHLAVQTYYMGQLTVSMQGCCTHHQLCQTLTASLALHALHAHCI